MNPAGGGPSQGVRQITSLYAKFDVQGEIVCFDEPSSPWLSDLAVPCSPLGSGIGSYAYHSKFTTWLKAHCHRFDAFVINGLWQYHSFAAWKILREVDKPYFVYCHGMLDSWFKKNYPLKHLKKWLYWPWADYRVLRDAAAVLFTSEEEMRLAPESFSLYEVTPRVVKYGAAAPPQNANELKENFLSAHPRLSGKRLFLFLSRIHEKKGCDILIEAFSRVSSADADVVLVIAGPDQTGLMPKLKKLAESLGVADRIYWPGMLQGDMKWGAFYASEIFILPSHQENFGIAVAEALGCSLPVLISDKVNIWREVIADGAGLVGADSVDGTEKNLRSWIEMLPAIKAKVSAQALITFENRYAANQMTKSLIETISEFV